MLLRRSVVLGLTLIGILLLGAGATNRMSKLHIYGGGCVWLAWTYYVVTKPRGDR